MANQYTTGRAKPQSSEQRFWPKVDKNGPLWNGTPCWLWTAAQDGRGYGAFHDYIPDALGVVESGACESGGRCGGHSSELQLAKSPTAWPLLSNQTRGSR